MRVRPARAEDSGPIAEVMVASWRSTYAGLLDQAFLNSMEVADQAQRWLAILTGQSHSTAVFVALDPAGAVVGFASGGRERELDPTYRGELHSVYLLDDHQGQGLGAALVAAVATWLADHRMNSMLVWVLRDNLRARAFYEHLGGRYLRPVRRRLRELEVDEVSYGWLDTAPLREPR